MLLGAGVRLATYLQNRSLWLDEALVSNQHNDAVVAHLAVGTTHQRSSRHGFLLGTKLVTTVTGSSEWSLRLIPLVAGIAGLAAFWYLAQSLLPAAGALMALALFALSEPLIYYSNEVKPYGIDAFATTLILIAFTQCLNARLSWAAILLSISVPWLSYPSGIVVGASGAVVLLTSLHGRDHRNLSRLLIMGILGLASCAALYVTAMHFLTPGPGRLLERFLSTTSGLGSCTAVVLWRDSPSFNYSLGALSGVAIFVVCRLRGSFCA